MKLVDLYEKTGGAATAEEGTIRIKKSDIAPTITHFSKLTGIPARHLHKIGSTGKMDTSGDIDLAVDINEYPIDTIHARLVRKLGDDACTPNKGTGVYSYAVPIKGDKNKGLVQIDLMFTPNTEWAKFSYHSEGTGSKYKGAIRTILLSAVAAAINKQGTDHFEYDEDGSMTVRVGRSLDLNQGLRRIFQFRPPRKDGKGLTKTLKSISVDEFKAQFPNVKVNGGQLIIDDPTKVLKVMFGGQTSPDDVRTAEQVLQLIKRKFSEEEQERIFTIAKSRTKPLVGKMRLPVELSDEVE